MRRKPLTAWEKLYRWNIPLLVQSRSKWNNTNYTPKAWLRDDDKDQQLKDGTLNIPDDENKENFVVINSEEIGNENCFVHGFILKRDFFYDGSKTIVLRKYNNLSQWLVGVYNDTPRNIV